MDNEEYRARMAEDLKNLNEQLQKARAYLIKLNADINTKHAEYKSFESKKVQDQELYSNEVFELVASENKKVQAVKDSIERTSSQLRLKDCEIKTNIALIEAREKALRDAKDSLSLLSASLSDKTEEVSRLELEYNELISSSKDYAEVAKKLKDKYTNGVQVLANSREEFEKERNEYRDRLSRREADLIDQKKALYERHKLLNQKEAELDQFYKKCKDMEELAISQMKVLANTQKYLQSK